MTVAHATIEAALSGRLGTFSLDIAVQCPMRGITALFGPSGCGKTTLLRAVAGLQRMNGKLMVGNQVWQDDSCGIFRPPHERSIGYVFQEASLFPHLSVRHNLDYGFRRIRTAERQVAFEEAVELLGIATLLQRRPDQLSGGQRQRVAIARALLASPQLLLMDEPLAALDRRSKAEILPYLESLHAKLSMPVLYVSHAPEEIARLADHLVMVQDGRVRAAGPLAELRTRLDIARDAGTDADALIDAQIAEHDRNYHLSYVNCPGGRFTVSLIDHPVGHHVRLRVLARDVSITLCPQSGTSILNIFPAVVQELAADTDAQMLVRLDLGGMALLARITRKSAELLDLLPGKRVYAQVKAVALLS